MITSKREIKKLTHNILKTNDSNSKEEIYNILIDTKAFFNFMNLDNLKNMLNDPTAFNIKEESFGYRLISEDYEVDEYIAYENNNILQGYFLRIFKKLNK